MTCGAQIFQFSNNPLSKISKCGTCWHFFNEPFIDHEGNEFIGCGNDRMVIKSIDPISGNALTYRHIIATDAACEDYQSL